MSAAAAAGTGSDCVSKRCLSLLPCAQKGSGTFSSFIEKGTHNRQAASTWGDTAVDASRLV